MRAKVLVTGAAGFIGRQVVECLLEAGVETVGLDNLNEYYDVSLKHGRLATLTSRSGFRFLNSDLRDVDAIRALQRAERFSHIIHLAAQPGVRYSLSHPQAYIDNNITATLNLLEAARECPPEHLVFASTSSVYGLNTQMPFSPHHGADHPVSLYAATKRAGELMCHNYALLFGLSITALRFFTVYGPWVRPDMALHTFTQKILAGEPIQVFNHGHHKRDFTYVEDIAEGVIQTCWHPATPLSTWRADAPDPAGSSAAYRVYNIGRGVSVPLSRYIELLEQHLGCAAIKEFLPKQPGDVDETWADVTDLERDIGYRPKISVEEGIERFVSWYRGYYR
jgi:UDP-glucuronate 4-epimerase